MAKNQMTNSTLKACFRGEACTVAVLPPGRYQWKTLVFHLLRLRPQLPIDLARGNRYTRVYQACKSRLAPVWRGLEGEDVFSSSQGDLTRTSPAKLAGGRQRALSFLKAPLLKVPIESLFATLFPGECRI